MKELDYEALRATIKTRLREVTNGNAPEEIALKIGHWISFADYISGMIEGKYPPMVYELVEIANAYNVTTDYLLGRTEDKEPAPAVAGQALTGNYNTNNIAQSSEVVNSFIEFLPILINLAEQHFGDIKILTVDGNDISGGSFKLAGIRFENGDGWRCRLLVEAYKRGEES